jgi:putative ABC transport system permease protein
MIPDIRSAIRTLRRSPGFAAAAIGTLALGIGANTAIFSVVNAVLLRPLPYPHPERIVWATEFFPKFNQSLVLIPEFASWRRETSTFERIEACGVTIGVNLSTKNQPAERVQAGHVTPGFFSMLGVQPELGRGFLPDDNQPTRDAVAVLSDSLWRDSFYADSHIVGKTVILDGAPHVIAGVMPSGLLFPASADTGVWLPDAVGPGDTVPSRGMNLVTVIGRLKRGVNRDQARADLEVIARRMDSQYLAPWSRYHAAAKVRVVSLQTQLTSGSRTALYVLLAAVGFILLIVCANLANLCLARAVTRNKEIAIRAAIGASRARVARLLLVESLVLGALGGTAGLALAYWGSSALRFLLPEIVTAAAPIDWHVLGFVALCSLATGILFGALPALTASRLDLNANLKDSGTPRMRTRRGPSVSDVLAVGQLALSLILLIGAGLLLRSFLDVLRVNSGFDPRNILIADVSLAPVEMYTPARQVAFYDRALSALKTVQGVEYAGLSSSTPLVPFNEVASGLRVEGETESDETVCVTSANDDYFTALRIPLLAGRLFDDRDRQGKPRTAIINQTLARVLFKNRDPIGRRINYGDGEDPWVTVVGIVGDIHHRALDRKVWAELFLPYAQAPSHWMSFVIRSSGDPSRLSPAIRKAVQSIDRDQPLFGMGSLDERVSESLAQRRSRAFLLCALALVALLIAVVGVYSVVSYSATQRTHEIGIRLALGAQPRDVWRLIMLEGLRTASVGGGLGLAGALALTRLLKSFLFGVSTTDGLTFASLCLLLIAAASLASHLPARRAMKVDPIVALRHE